MTQMNIVEVFAQLANSGDGAICDEATLGQHEVSQARSSVHNPLHSVILDIFACR
jgi:hypothetical protein